MINYKSLQTAIMRAINTYSNEGAYPYYTVYALFQDPARADVNYSVVDNVFTADINPILGKRVRLNDTETYYIATPAGNSFHLANSYENALNDISITIQDGVGLIRDEDITADDAFEVLESYSVGQGNNTSYGEPLSYSENGKTYLNFNIVNIPGPIPNISHILILFSPNLIGGDWGPNIYETLVYGLSTSSVYSVPVNQTLQITIKPYMGIPNA